MQAFKRYILLIFYYIVPLVFNIVYSYLQIWIQRIPHQISDSAFKLMIPYTSQILFGILTGVFYCLLLLLRKKVTSLFKKSIEIDIGMLFIYLVLYLSIAICLITNLAIKFWIANLLIFSPYIISISILILYQYARFEKKKVKHM